MNRKQNKNNYTSPSYVKNNNNNNKEIKENKRQENKQSTIKTESINTVIDQGVKIKVGNKLLEMEKNEEKLIKLQKIIQEQENTINILKQGV